MKLTRVLVLGLLAFLLAGPPVAHAEEAERATPDPAVEARLAKARLTEAIAAKRAHFLEVVEELGARDVAHLTTDQAKRRREALQALELYALRGVFPIDTRNPGFAVPYLIDERGTFCALAHLVKDSGAGAIIRRLAERQNHDFVPALAADRELRAWLARHGFSLEEAGYIQFPGFVDVVDEPTIVEVEDIEEEVEPDLPQQLPRSEDPTGNVKGGPAATGGNDTARRRPRSAGGSASDWEVWWRLHRAHYTNLREHYHKAPATTGMFGDGETGVSRRPSSEDLAVNVVPALKKVAAAGGELGGTALMALARLQRPEDAAFITDGALQYAKTRNNPYRGLMLLAIGLAKTETGIEALRAIVTDAPLGRVALGARTAVPSSVRALAAVALGLSESEADVATLLGVLADDGSNNADLRAACVAALGQLGAQAGPMRKVQIRAKLVEAARDRTWSDPVLAAVPTALLRMGDDLGLEALTPHLARFRKPTALRRSLVLAYGNQEAPVTLRVVNMLIASAQRDPDGTTRRLAIAALGQRTPGLDVETDDAVKARRAIARFFVGALKGHYVKSVDRPWVYLGAALHAREDTRQRERVQKALSKALLASGARDARGAAAVALGLLGAGESRGDLRKVLGDVRDVNLRAHVAEALGLVRDRGARPDLMKLLRGNEHETVRLAAARGLAHTADRSVVEPLLRSLARSRSGPERAALTRLLGELGDVRALEGLVALAADEAQDDLNRVRAVAALGLIGESAAPTWTEAFKRGANHEDATRSLRLVLSLF